MDDNRIGQDIKMPEINNINAFRPFTDDNKKGPEPEAKELYLEKETSYDNNDDQKRPPMAGVATWATREEIQKLLAEHKKEMDEAQEEADLLPGAGGGPDLRGGTIDDKKHYYEALRSELLNEAYEPQEEKEKVSMTL